MYGKLEKLSLEEKETPFDATFDKNGRVTRKPEDIIESREVFPIGYHKGSGLSIVLDLIASILSGGLTTRLIGFEKSETKLCQVFMSIFFSLFPDRERIDSEIEKTLSDIKASTLISPESPIHTPGEDIKRIREESMEKGVLVDESKWQTLSAM